ncbi:MAG: RagB/SusD family nutrient uptake outer membrane protein, partial [Odoribacteraceae bacterium]|nr:RagB/SusD family nutrient uptake outer membrane protein [Odoribacteraceae bacterium]
MKRINKQLNYALACACAAILLGACSRSFLEPDPLSFYEPTTTFSSESGLQAALANCDKNLRNNWTHYSANSNSAPIATEYVYSELSVASKTDVSNILSNIDQQLNPITEDLGHEGGDFRPFYWTEGYNGVKGANTIISFIDAVKGLDEPTKNAYLGRAYFHRAFRYYNLVFQFGDVPLITKILETPKQNYRSTKKEAILDMITADLEFAVKWVPNQSEMTYVGMVNKGACRVLLAKCYLATGQFQKAKLQADTLIDLSGYSLVKNNFGSFIQNYAPETWPVTRNVIWDLHRPENKLIAANTEVIMGLPNRGATAESMIPFYTMRVFGPMWNNANIKTPDGMNAVNDFARNNSAYTTTLDYTRAIGRGIGCYHLTWFATHELWNVNGAHDDGDLRHSTTTGNWGLMENIKCNNRSSAYYNQPISLKNGYTISASNGISDTVRIWFDWPHYKLYLHDVAAEANQSSTQFSGATNGANADWYLYRLAEVYLLRAEAKFYLGDATAATDVNTVRERAQCARLYSTVNIGDIMNERARELYLEEWRNVELTRVSRSLALSGKPDEWGNTYDVNTYDK